MIMWIFIREKLHLLFTLYLNIKSEKANKTHIMRQYKTKPWIQWHQGGGQPGDKFKVRKNHSVRNCTAQFVKEGNAIPDGFEIFVLFATLRLQLICFTSWPIPVSQPVTRTTLPETITSVMKLNYKAIKLNYKTINYKAEL